MSSGKTAHDISIITIANKEDVYQKFKANLEEQSGVDYELIKIRNDRHQYSSARTAYNQAVAKATGKDLLFLHPDIRFLDKRALADVLQQAWKLPNRGVVGIAGVPDNLGPYHIMTTMKQGVTPRSVGVPIDRPTKIQTVDECFFIFSKQFWEQHPFSDIEGWHLYAVEECLQAIMDGKTNYVVPSRICHASDGVSEDWNYVKTGRQIVKRYGAHFPIINTTVYKWNTHGARQYFMPWFHYLDHRAERGLRKYPLVHQTVKKVKHIFIKPA